MHTQQELLLTPCAQGTQLFQLQNAPFELGCFVLGCWRYRPLAWRMRCSLWGEVRGIYTTARPIFRGYLLTGTGRRSICYSLQRRSVNYVTGRLAFHCPTAGRGSDADRALSGLAPCPHNICAILAARAFRVGTFQPSPFARKWSGSWERRVLRNKKAPAISLCLIASVSKCNCQSSLQWTASTIGWWI